MEITIASAVTLVKKIQKIKKSCFSKKIKKSSAKGQQAFVDESFSCSVC